MLRIINENKIDFSYAVLISFLVLYVVPVYMISNNYIYFQELDIVFTIGFFFAFSLLFSLIIVLFYILIGPKLSNKLFPVTRYFLFFFLIFGIFFPFSSQASRLNPGLILHNQYILIIGLSLAVAIFIFSMKYNRIVFVFTTIILIMNGVVSTFIILSNISHNSNKDIYALSSKRNVVVFSIDGLSRDVSLEILEENPEFSDIFKDFTTFKNVISSANSTFPSISAELSGVPNIKKSYGTVEKLLYEIEKQSLLTNRLKNKGYTVSTYGYYIYNFEDKERSFPDGTLDTNYTVRQKIDRGLDILEISMGRMVVFQNLRYLIIKSIDQISSLAGFRKTDIRKSITLREFLEHHEGRKGDKSTVPTLLDLEKYIKNLHIETDTPVGHFLQFAFTHYPVDFDEKCAYRSYDSKWFRESQNRIGSKKETYCAFLQFSQLIQKLKELGVYDKTFLVLKSDHGQTIDYADREKYESFSIHNHKEWGFSRYTPFLAIKDFGVIKDSITVNEQPVVLTDLAKTLCIQVLKPMEGCDNYSGYNLLDNSVDIPPEPGVAIFIPKDETATFRLDDMVSFELPRLANFYETLNDRLTSEFLSKTPACHSQLKFDTYYRYNNGFTDNSSFVTWHDGSVNYIKFKLPVCDFAETVVKGKRKNLSDSSFEMRIQIISNDNVINENIVSLTPNNTGDFDLKIPKSIFSDKQHPESTVTLKFTAVTPETLFQMNTLSFE